LNLLVSETFYSIQGEGPLMGTPCLFIRTAYCNLHCTWCDAWYTWDHKRADVKKESFSIPVEDLIKDVRRHRVIIITGGEPLLQRDALEELIGWAGAYGRLWQFETNGTRPPLRTNVDIRYVVSPKLSNNEADPFGRRIKYDVLRQFLGRTHYFKFVIDHPEDVDEAVHIVNFLGLDNRIVWLMPQAVDSDMLSLKGEWIAEECKRRGWMYSDRLHIRLYGDQRGT